MAVSTTIVQTFVCVKIDEEYLLRAHLTLSCDPSSARRRMWKTWATIMMVAYPIGFPLLLICLLLPQRARIRELMVRGRGMGGARVRRGVRDDYFRA